MPLFIWKNALSLFSPDCYCEQGLHPCVNKHGRMSPSPVASWPRWGDRYQCSEKFQKLIKKDPKLLKMVVCDHTSQEWLLSDDYRTRFSVFFLWHCSDWDCVCFDICCDMEGVQWRAVDKPAAPQATAGGIFPVFLSFSLCPLLLATRICFSAFTMAASLRGYRDFLRQQRSHFWIFSWTIRWPANISSLCVALLVVWSHLACLLHSVSLSEISRKVKFLR